MNINKVTGFLLKNSKNQINKAYKTRAYFFYEFFFGPEKGPLLMLLILFKARCSK